MSALWQVFVEERRTAIYFVVADSQSEAESDGKVLAEELRDEDFEVENFDVDVYRASDASGPVWTGGVNGEWITAVEYNRTVTS